ncbi:MAG: C4-type zinc ribbon domain-containing protein [Candidatus Scalindua sp.]|nr:C4-type zinc ribbon domain-containing protein [Candidatus Scalindua sp.]
MNERIDVLKRLQAIQNKITERTHFKELQSEEIEKKKAALQQKKTLSGKKHEEVISFQKEIDRRDLDLKSAEERIKKFTVQLNSIKNNKEYSALRSEISSKEADKSLLEDEILNLMTQLESANEEYLKTMEKLSNDESNIDAFVRSANSEIQKADEEIALLKRDASKYTDLLDHDTLRQFNRLTNAKEESPIVEVVGNACSGCSMNIRLQTLNLLMSGKNLTLCPNCQRILFLNDRNQ